MRKLLWTGKYRKIRIKETSEKFCRKVCRYTRAGTRDDSRLRSEQSVLGAPLHTVRPAATDVVAWSSRSVSGSTRHSPCASKTRSHPRSPTLVAGNPAIWASNTFFRNFPQIEEILRISLKRKRMNSFASFSFTELTDRYRRKIGLE